MNQVNKLLYKLGFIDNKGNPEKNKDKRWMVGLNQAEFIVKTAFNECEYKAETAALMALNACGVPEEEAVKHARVAVGSVFSVETTI